MKKYFFLQCSILVLLFHIETNAQNTALKDSLSIYKPDKCIDLDSLYVAKYTCVNFDLNYFQFYSEDSPNWEKLYNKIQNMLVNGDAKLNFYHIGGSHLQADIYTHQVREKVQTTWQNLPGERAWVFPFDLARTNNPWNYEFSSTNKWSRYRSAVPAEQTEVFGIMGAKVTCLDSLMNVRFNYDKTNVKQKFNRIKVFHNKGAFPFEFDWDKNQMFMVNQIWDSVIGCTEVNFTEPIDNFEMQIERCTPDSIPFELFGFQLLNELPGISYSSIGINGAGLYTYLECDNFAEQLNTLPPDLFTFSVGTNDANKPYDDFDPEIYKSNLEKMMQIVLRVNPECAILLTVPNDSYFQRTQLNRNIGRQRTVILELSAKYKVPVWDFYGIMGELGSSKTWYSQKLMRADLVHFNTAGYHLKGDLFFDAFQKFLVQFGIRDLASSKKETSGEH